MSKIIQVFLNSDMRQGHEGLAHLAKQNNIDVSALSSGDYVIFINTQKNKLKLYAANDVIAYLRLAQGTIDLRTIALIPAAFNSKGKINYDAALKEVLLNGLKK